jgi:hypothetical protein
MTPTSKTIAIIQSNYIPWKGYFDIIALCDEFMLFDEAQYTRRDWRNRNQIKTPQGLHWLTIPVNVKGKFTQRIDETTLQSARWVDEHLKTLRFNYAKSACFGMMFPQIEALYRQVETETSLSQVNYKLLRGICDLLGIKTPIIWSTDYQSEEGRLERVLSLCVQAGATEYISGPSAKSYMVDEAFEQNGIQVTYMDYSAYPEYPQLFPPFEHGVSILDLLFNVGEDAPRYMKHATKRDEGKTF